MKKRLVARARIRPHAFHQLAADGRVPGRGARRSCRFTSFLFCKHAHRVLSRIGEQLERFRREQ